ncbi:hypothetical protein BH24ACT13_BH24ACT13_02830 [soil metagenome]
MTGELIVAAWNAFLAVAERADLTAASRLPGWTGHDVCVHLGGWPEHRTLDRMRAAARRRKPATPHPGVDTEAEPAAHPDDVNEHLVAAHRGAHRDEVLNALREARDSVADFLPTPEAARLRRRPVPSPLGPLPLLTLVHASTYELAVHAADLRPCGGGEPDDALLQAGLGSLVDVTGALAARQGRAVAVTARTPTGGWTVRSGDSGGWRTVRREAAEAVLPTDGVVVEGSPATLLDVSAGRIAVPPLLLRRELRLHDIPGLLELAPIVEAVPGLPGGLALRAAAGYVGGAGRLLRRLPRAPWR